MQSLGDALREAGFGPLLAKIAPAALADDAPLDDEPAVCERCRGAGFLRRNVMPGEPGFGEPVECSCELGRARAAKRQLRILGDTGVPPRFRGFTLDTLSGPYAELAQTLRAWTPDRWLLLTGPKGTCKTGGAAALAMAWLREHGEGTVLFIKQAKWLERIRETYDDAEGPNAREVLQQLVDVPLLVLDDVGAEKLTEWGQEKLFTVIDDRSGLHDRGTERPTIVTTNLSLERLAQHMDAKGRTLDRIQEFARVIETQGESRRRQARLPYADDQLPF